MRTLFCGFGVNLDSAYNVCPVNDNNNNNNDNNNKQQLLHSEPDDWKCRLDLDEILADLSNQADACKAIGAHSLSEYFSALFIELGALAQFRNNRASLDDLVRAHCSIKPINSVKDSIAVAESIYIETINPLFVPIRLVRYL